MYVYVGSEDYVHIKLGMALSEALIGEYIFKHSSLCILFPANIFITILRALRRF